MRYISEPLSSHKFCITGAHLSQLSLKVGGRAAPGPPPPSFLLSITTPAGRRRTLPAPPRPPPFPGSVALAPRARRWVRCGVVPASHDLMLSWAPHRTCPGFGPAGWEENQLSQPSRADPGLRRNSQMPRPHLALSKQHSSTAF